MTTASAALLAPTIEFAGGSVQILNPGYPIPGVMADVLTLIPNGTLAAHRHDHNSSLLMCVSGTGEIRIDDDIVPLTVGSAVYIHAGSEHEVRAQDGGMTCLSINTGIAPPSGRPDLHFVEAEPEGFAQRCTAAAAEFAAALRRESPRQLAFEFELPRR